MIGQGTRFSVDSGHGAPWESRPRAARHSTIWYRRRTSRAFFYLYPKQPDLDHRPSRHPPSCVPSRVSAEAADAARAYEDVQ